jgi:hypothetical protein
VPVGERLLSEFGGHEVDAGCDDCSDAGRLFKSS